METIKKYDVDKMRAKASRLIHGMFKGASVINVQYKDTFAEASCLWPDGVMEFFAVFYHDLRDREVPMGQYDRARRIVEETFEKEAVCWR